MIGCHRKHLPLVVVFVSERTHLAQLQAMFSGRATVIICDTEERAHSTLASCPVDLLVAGLERRGESVIPFLQTVRSRLPGVTIIAYAELVAHHMAHLLEAGRIGVAELLIHGVSYSHREIDPLLRKAQAYTLLAHFNPTLSRVRSEYVRRFVKYCLVHAAEPMTVAGVASAIGASRQHIAREFRESGLRDPQWFLHKARVLLATKLLTTRAQPVQRVAQVLQFKSSTALRHALRAHTGMTATQLRESDGFARMLARVQDALEPSGFARTDTAGDRTRTDVPFVNPIVPFVNNGRVAALV